MTESLEVAIGHAAMFLRLPYVNARRFAALLLLVGVMLGGTIDAAACEPATEADVSMIVFEGQPDNDRLPDGNHDDVCMHGHCHHGISHVQLVADLTEMPAYDSDHPLGHDRSLPSIIPDTLKRPPRA